MAAEPMMRLAPRSTPGERRENFHRTGCTESVTFGDDDRLPVSVVEVFSVGEGGETRDDEREDSSDDDDDGTDANELG